jgi:hypothetical protein
MRGSKDVKNNLKFLGVLISGLMAFPSLVSAQNANARCDYFLNGGKVYSFPCRVMNEWQGPGRPETIAFVDNLKSGDRYSVGKRTLMGAVLVMT